MSVSLHQKADNLSFVSDSDSAFSALKSGTTAVVAVLRNSQELVVGSVGDSTAILCRSGVAHPLNQPHHTPSVQTEQQRIQSRGGFIATNSLGD